ncbi:hypothetical protein C8J57DRAFT_1394006 [Mycena rebaudengoi]|nr:hypothetical protein C8J57DRAFT_1394006 [Mycena rebaudengoi]
MPTFPSLRTLALHNIGPYYLDFGGLTALLRSAPLLEHPEMHLIHVSRPLPPGSMPTVFLPRLTHFDIAFGNAATVTLLLPYLSAPAITPLTFTLDSTYDVRDAIECATAFEGAPPYLPLPLFNLYSAFTRLESLDLTLFVSNAFSDLVALSRNTSVLHHLRVLFLGREDLPLIKEFAQLHGAKDASFTSPPFLRIIRADLPVSLSPKDMEVISWLLHHLELFKRYDVDSKY